MHPASFADTSLRLFLRVEVVLEEYPDALRPFHAVAERVEAVAVAKDDLVVFLLGRVGYAASRAGLPVAPLLKPGQVIQARRGRLQPEIPVMPFVEGDAV